MRRAEARRRSRTRRLAAYWRLKSKPWFKTAARFAGEPAAEALKPAAA
jgi:hypothetical protein